MIKIIRKSTLFVLFAAFSLPVLAQPTLEGPGLAGSPDLPQGLPPGSSVLYDQSANPGLGYTSQDFEPALDTSDSQGADDFTVSDAAGWTVTQVNVLGTDELTPATLFNVWFYADDSGTPGAEVCVRNGQTGVNDGTGNADIELGSGCFLPMGTYWVSVQADKDSQGGADQWFWVTSTVVAGTAAQFRNPGDGFATGCTSFSDLASCVGGDPLDFGFQIAGVTGNAAGGTRATFAVTKVFADGNDVDEVDVALDCNTGLILDQDKTLGDGESVEFVVTEFTGGQMTCFIVENGTTTGYSADYSGDGVDGGCEWEQIQDGDAYTCTVTNSPDPVDVEITKEWVIENNSGSGVNTEYELTLSCDSEIIGGYNPGVSGAEESQGIIGIPVCGVIFNGPEQPGIIPFDQWCKTFSGNDSDVFVAEVIPDFPDSSCYVYERVFDSGIEIDNGCLNLTVSAGAGDSCTITNTVFYEGIPTLNQYGMAMLALLMLGLGFVGFRRFN